MTDKMHDLHPSINGLVTIGITAYNAEDSIESAVRSALEQRYRPIEIVIVNDASTDGTASILDLISPYHPEVKIIHRDENGGVAIARNEIIANSRGEFVAFFDDDDRSEPNRIEVQLERLLDYEARFANNALVICHSARKQIYPDGLERIEKTMGEAVGQVVPNGPAVARRILLGEALADAYGSLATCSQLARRNVYAAIGGFDPTFRRSEDTDFSIRLALQGGHFVGVSAPLVIQSMTPGSEKRLAEEHRYMAMIFMKNRELLDQHTGLEFALNWLDVRHTWLAGNRLRFLIKLLCLGLRHPRPTIYRIIMAAPNYRLNQTFRKFHQDIDGRDFAPGQRRRD